MTHKKNIILYIATFYYVYTGGSGLIYTLRIFYGNILLLYAKTIK